MFPGWGEKPNNFYSPGKNPALLYLKEVAFLEFSYIVTEPLIFAYLVALYRTATTWSWIFSSLCVCEPHSNNHLETMTNDHIQSPVLFHTNLPLCTGWRGENCMFSTTQILQNTKYLIGWLFSSIVVNVLANRFQTPRRILFEIANIHGNKVEINFFGFIFNIKMTFSRI